MKQVCKSHVPGNGNSRPPRMIWHKNRFFSEDSTTVCWICLHGTDRVEELKTQETRHYH